MSLSHRLAVIAIQDVFSYHLSLGPNYEKSRLSNVYVGLHTYVGWIKCWLHFLQNTCSRAVSLRGPQLLDQCSSTLDAIFNYI